MDEDHLAAAIRCVSLNPVRAGAGRCGPVRAGLVAWAADWEWSSVRAHPGGRDDGPARVWPVLDRFPRFADMLETAPSEAQLLALRRSETSGRPLGRREWAHALGARRERRGKRRT